MNSITSSEYLNPVSTQTWVNGRHLVRCLKVIRETADVFTYCFSMQEPVLFFFKPGQFVTLELEIDGEHGAQRRHQRERDRRWICAELLHPGEGQCRGGVLGGQPLRASQAV